MNNNNWIWSYIYRYKILFRVNIFFGLYFWIKKYYLKIVIRKFEYPQFISDVFSINKNQEIFSTYFANNENQKKLLIKMANDFLNNDVRIYNKQINLSNYSVNRFTNNLNNGEIFNKDIRFHWEIYRVKYLVQIGIAYKITNNEDYALALIKFINNWEKFSPIINPALPYNGMEASLKLIYLSLVDSLLSDSLNYTSVTKRKLVESIVQHTEYVYKNYDITIYGLESNHALCCSVGLVYASLIFPDHQNSTKWYKFGMRALRRALKKQFTKDGVNFESSVNYHRFVFEILVFLLSALYKNNIPVELQIEKSIQKIGNALLQLTHKNAFISRFGDSDGGKFLPDLNTTDNFNNMDYLEWFTDSIKKQYFETILFDNISQFENFLVNNSPNGRIGEYISFKDKMLSLIVSANEIGTLGKGNHQHNDFMSFELYSATPFIVDPWSYCYTGNYEFRNNDRKTKSHNCIELDNREIVPFDSSNLFEMLGNIKVYLNSIKETSEYWDASLTHNAYKNLYNGSQIHTREFQYNKVNNKLLIEDTLVGKGTHTASLDLFIPKEYWRLENCNNQLQFYNENEYFILENNWQSINISEDYISDMFLNRKDAYRIIFSANYTNSADLSIMIAYKFGSH